MELKKPAVAGTMESSDIMVMLRPNEGRGIEIDIQSDVKATFGEAIKATIREVLEDFGVNDAMVAVVDKGALDFVIRARMQCAICRAAEIEYDWGKEDPHVWAKLMRTSMYAGGTSPVKMIQAGFYNEDCLVYDLEDSVSAGEKDAARFLVYNAVKYQRPKDKYILIRVNGIYSKELDEDLEAAMRAQPDAIRIPKVEYAEEVQRIDAKMTAIEEKAGLPIGGVKLWCNIESYLGVIHAQEIATASPRVEAMALGAEDFTASMSAQRTKPGWEIFYARNAILMACRAAGISAQDAVFSDINDAEGLQKDLEMTRTLGFDGKTCVHPRQIDTVNACFTPSAKEIRNAQRVLEALEEAARNHTGVCVLDGGMVDKPMELRARTTLAKAEAAGIKVGGSK